MNEMNNMTTATAATDQTQTDNILEVKGLKQYFKVKTGFFSSLPLKAVDDVSFEIKRGRNTWLVESVVARLRSADP